tara:strand:+ start:617 stop:928 length:312 start_codon:yes stop_codon:yes gene_type:complete
MYESSVGVPRRTGSEGSLLVRKLRRIFEEFPLEVDNEVDEDADIMGSGGGLFVAEQTSIILGEVSNMVFLFDDFPIGGRPNTERSPRARMIFASRTAVPPKDN